MTERIVWALWVDSAEALNPVTIWKPAIVEWGDVQWV